MKIKFIFVVILSAFMFLTAAEVSAQSGLTGKYTIRKENAAGQADNISFELKSKNTVIYTKSNPALEQHQERKGTWKFNQAANEVTVTFPPSQNGEYKEAAVTVVFKVTGKNLKVIKVVPADAGTIGDVFKKENPAK